MTIDPSALEGERVAELLAECDEALAAGDMLRPLGDTVSVYACTSSADWPASSSFAKCWRIPQP